MIPKSLKRTSIQEITALEADILARLQALPDQHTDTVRTLRRDFSRRLVDVSPDTVVGLANKLIQRSSELCRFIAYELVQHHKAASQSLNASQLERLGRGIDNWGAVDTFACYLAGVAWREHLITDNLIHRWARSKDRWWRRAALVSTVPLNNKARGGSGDHSRTLQVCEMLTHDRDDMVVKALSWALRELAKRNPKAVSAFVKEHQAVLAPRVIREVKNKLRTGLKNPQK